ncbi:MAG TPA: DUF1552 domain-containing protein [Planctomycetota bacterium]|jgi:hypothetical protein|nr:DUF1552 domain-containing protein [Planctomycetota bacterium]
MTPTRRSFLRAAGVSLALPWLEALAPKRSDAAESEPKRRMVCLGAPLGFHAPNFFPQKAGKDYPLSPYLEILKDLRNDFTVMSGLCHPDVAEGHDSGYSFLTGAHHKGFMRKGFRNTISLDQLAAEQIGGKTRVASLTLSTEGDGLSWTRSGVLVPPSLHPSGVFAQLFLEGGADEVESQMRRIRQGQSILDHVRDLAKAMEPGLGVNDREKLDEYFTSVRELEQRMDIAKEWATKPKPKVGVKQVANPANVDIVARCRTWFDLTLLALQTDSTRLVSILLNGGSHGAPPILGVAQNHHDLSHHGQDPKKLEQLRLVEVEVMKTLSEFLTKLKTTQEEGVSLLDRTMVFLGSNLGNANSHATKNLPVLLAGGGFKHGQHLAFTPESAPPLCNLFVSMLQRLGLSVDRFGSSTGTLSGLEMTT